MDYEKMMKEDYPLPNKYLVDVNWDCNLNCIMCVKRGIHKPSGQRNLSDFITIVEKLPWSKEISLGCLGDAFSYKELEEAMTYLRSKKIIAPLTSNGTQIDDNNIKILTANNPLYISIDAGTKERYKEIRGKDFLPLIKENLNKIRTNNPNIGVAINHLVFNNNLQD